MAIDLSDDGVCITTREPIAEEREVELYFFNRSKRVMSVVRNQDALGNGQHRIGLGFARSEPELVRLLLTAQATRQD